MTWMERIFAGFGLGLSLLLYFNYKKSKKKFFLPFVDLTQKNYFCENFFKSKFNE